MTLRIAGALVLQEKDWTDTVMAAQRTSPARNRVVRVSGEESAPPLTEAQAVRRREAILGLADLDEPVQVVCTANDDLNGWYRVLRTQAMLRRHTDTTELVRVPWELSLERLGHSTDVALECQLVGTTRTNDHGVSPGERWHAVPAGAEGIYYGTSSPATLTRTGALGSAVTVYRSIPADTPARYLLDAANAASIYTRCNITDLGAEPYTGLGHALDPADWSMSNGHLRVSQDASEAFALDFSDGWLGWESSEDYRVLRQSTALGVPDAVQVLRHDWHTSGVRLVWTVAGVGQVTMDLMLRLGAHHVSWVVRCNTASTLGVEVHDGAHTASTGYIEDSTDDADGNRWLLGSPETNSVTTPTGWRGLQETSVLVFDGYAGIEQGGASAVSGNEGDDIRNQYLEDRAETVRVVAP
jgi:hypothetical protein